MNRFRMTLTTAALATIAFAGAGQAAPWNMTPDTRADAQPGLYLGEGIQFQLVAESRQCAVTADIGASTTLADVSAAANRALGFGPGQTGDSNDSIFWAFTLDGNPQRFGAGLKVSDQSGTNLATFLVLDL